MRLYSFVNYYLSPLQHGLQTAHCVSEMAVDVARTSLGAVFYDWAENHKTIIICNGGNVAMLEDLYSTLIDLAAEFNLPLVKFYEDEQSLNGALTSVAIIIPEVFYAAKYIPGNDPDNLIGRTHYASVDVNGSSIFFETDTPEFQLIQLIKSFRLA